jgi:hypothetical protein
VTANLALTGRALLARYERAWLRPDVVAGVTVAAYLVPQVMAYAQLAGLDPVVGLWSAILLHWLWSYATQVVLSGVTRSPLYNWLECLPYVIMAAIVVLIWKPQTLSRQQKPLGLIVNQSDGVYKVR